jgi:hypothetical protein
MDDQPNKADTFYLLGSALIVAAIVLAVVWVFIQWCL